MIDFINIKKNFGAQIIFDNTSLRVNKNERVGVVGPNGAGKTTLFRLIIGEDEADSGEIIYPKNSSIGYVHQQLNPHKVDCSLIDFAFNANQKIKRIEAELDKLHKELENNNSKN